MANESMLLQNINVLTEDQFKNIPEEDMKRDELYLIPLSVNIFNEEGKLVFPNGSTFWIA